MKIIKKSTDVKTEKDSNYISKRNLPYNTYKTTCNECKSELEYNTDDLFVEKDIEGTRYYAFTCPVCGKKQEHNVCMADVVYPNDVLFFDFKGGASVDDKEINSMIKEIAKEIDKIKTGECLSIGTGNTIVFAEKEYDCVIIRVCRDYEECIIFNDEIV